VRDVKTGGAVVATMTTPPTTREEVRTLAGSLSTTPHPHLPAETIDRSIAFVDAVRDRLEDGEREAVQDLLAFWDGYVIAGLADAVDDIDAFERTTSIRERIERANAADLLGLDLYQALLKLAEALEDGAETIEDGVESVDAVTDRAVSWARRVGTLTGDFTAHLADHK